MRLAAFVVVAVSLAAQAPVVDRPWTAASRPLRIERQDRKFVSDSFRLGAAGEVWMIDSVRVWGVPATGSVCGKELGDSIAKITLLAALDNPPIPGQPVCDCHALVELAAIPLAPGSSVSGNPNASLSRKGNTWQMDFHEVRWSLPGGADALFTVRVTARTPASCPAGARWSLTASPAEADYRLRLLNEKGSPIGLQDPQPTPRTIDIQIWARRLP